ncbi:MAG TPA: spermidine synthase [Verrucomicrobiales bacterium]|nr:spermidine synthase [Roseibacillus sp.]HBM78556.1 spermidine synthase [Verrucomicrobiales bacterium]HCQ39561.1 spermidine synthase [Verrucomicrobiales bacterium]|tara:strand:+ start:870 stop:1595 length:726 start_codon:yes stop_codon:yes gene_type:complete
MPPDFEELDYQQTPLGTLILRRRRMRSLDDLEVYEIILGTGYLMSSLFTTVEIALADFALALLPAENKKLSVAVGGLGLGYTAQAALKDPRVSQLLVVEALPSVIGWHHQELVPLGREISTDPRCRLVEGDFFSLAANNGFDSEDPGRTFDAILLDIDHSPRNLIHERHQDFYSLAGLSRLRSFLNPGGIFAMWSDDPPDEDFENLLRDVFPSTESRIVEFPNPLQGIASRSTVYLAQCPD